MEKHLVYAFFLILSQSLFSQYVMFSHGENAGMVTFFDNVNLREMPNDSSKILLSLPKGSQLDYFYQTKKGSLNGKEVVWCKVRYNGNVGYIWEELLSNCYLKSQEDIGYSFRINNRNFKTNINIYYQGRLEHTQTLVNPDSLKFISVKSLGQTYNSNEADVFAFYYGDYDNSDLRFFKFSNGEFQFFTEPFIDSSFFQYNHRKEQLIVGNLVNFRVKPDADSAVIAVLKFENKITLIRERMKRDTIGNMQGYWSRVVCNKDTGYVWDPFISKYYFHSYKEKNLIFALRETESHMYQIIAIKNSKIIDAFSFRGISNFMGAHSMGSMGLTGVEDIIGVCYSGESCGVPSGDVLIAWNKGKFIKFVQDYGIGDGGLSYEHSVIFPSEINGQQGIIKITESDSEAIDLYKEDKEEDSYESVSEYCLTRNYTFLDGELTEIASETTEMEKLLKSNFANYKLNYFLKFDANKDGIEDVMLYAIDTANNETEEYYKRNNKSLMVLALGTKRKGYQVLGSTKKLISHGENRPLTEVVATEKGFCVKLFYSGYYNEEETARHFYMYFEYDKKSKNFLLKRTTEIFPPDNYSGSWDKKEYYYTKNKVLFKDAYHPEL